MIGYPYYYESYDLKQNFLFQDQDQEDKFMLFSLSKDEELRAHHLSSLPISVGPPEFTFGDKFNYYFCDEITKLCENVKFISETETLIVDYDGFCKIVSNADVIINNISSELDISKLSAMEKAQEFFQGKKMVVQAGGVQGAVYNVGSFIQSAGSAGLLTRTLGLAKLAGVNGFQILQAQPALAIAIPTTGAMFFYGCGAVAGDTAIGKILVSTGDILALPMRGVEIMWNSYGNPVIHKIFGFPVILNMTQTFKTGSGYTIEEMRKYVEINRPSIWKSVKSKLIKWLSNN